MAKPDNEFMEKCAVTIYKILSAFERSLDLEKFDMDEISPEILKISELRRNRYLQMLIESEYITGISVKELTDGQILITPYSPRITLKGIEYLAENSTMNKALQILKKGAEITIGKL